MVQPTSKPVVVKTVVSTVFPSSTTLSTVTTSDSNSTKSTNQGKTSQISASISPTCTMSCYYIASSAISTHSSAVHMRSSPDPKHSSETNPPGMHSDIICVLYDVSCLHIPLLYFIHCHADQQAKVIGIAVGSTCGVLILTAMLVTLIAIMVCLMLKKRKKASFNFSANVAYSKRTAPKVYNSAIVTEENIAYASSPNLSTANNNLLKGVDVEYESFHESTSTEFYSEAKRASIVDSLCLVTDKYIAYEPSLFSNIAYGSFHKVI